MTAADLMAEVDRHGGRLFPRGDRLRFTAPEPLPADLLANLRAHKPELLALLDPGRPPRALTSTCTR